MFISSQGQVEQLLTVETRTADERDWFQSFMVLPSWRKKGKRRETVRRGWSFNRLRRQTGTLRRQYKHQSLRRYIYTGVKLLTMCSSWRSGFIVITRQVQKEHILESHACSSFFLAACDIYRRFQEWRKCTPGSVCLPLHFFLRSGWLDSQAEEDKEFEEAWLWVIILAL